VRLAADDLVLQVPRQRYVTVGHHVLAARASGASLSVDLFHLRQEVVYRVQVVARFGLLATPNPLGGRIPFESEELDRASGTVRAMKHSVGWRVTEPLRRVADAGGCGRTHSERDGARVAPAEVLASLPAMPHQRQPRSVRTGISGAAVTRSVVGGIVRSTVRAGDGDD